MPPPPLPCIALPRWLTHEGGDETNFSRLEPIFLSRPPSTNPFPHSKFATVGKGGFRYLLSAAPRYTTRTDRDTRPPASGKEEEPISFLFFVMVMVPLDPPSPPSFLDTQKSCGGGGGSKRRLSHIFLPSIPLSPRVRHRRNTEERRNCGESPPPARLRTLPRPIVREDGNYWKLFGSPFRDSCITSRRVRHFKVIV